MLGWCFLIVFLLFSPSRAADPFEELNNMSLGLYESSLSVVLDTYLASTPIFFCNGQAIYFIYQAKGINASIPFAPDVFTRLKQVSHPLLSAFSVTDDSLQLQEPLTAPAISNITNYLTLLKALPGQIVSDKILKQNASFVEAALTIANMTTMYLSEVLQKGTATQALVEQYLKANVTMEALSVTAMAAAKAQLEDLNQFVQSFVGMIPADAWSRMRVLLVYGHMSRYSELHVQYFARLFNCSETDGSRLVYAEALSGWEKPLIYLTKHIVDFDIGTGLFDDPTRLHHDLLAPQATELLPQILPHHLDRAHRTGECPMMKRKKQMIKK
jgi:hypothetical protein